MAVNTFTMAVMLNSLFPCLFVMTQLNYALAYLWKEQKHFCFVLFCFKQINELLISLGLTFLNLDTSRVIFITIISTFSFPVPQNFLPLLKLQLSQFWEN